MPRVQEFKKITKHFFPSRELYIAAMERGEIKEGDEVFIEGSEVEGEELEFLSNMEIEELLRNFQ